LAILSQGRRTSSSIWGRWQQQMLNSNLRQMGLINGLSEHQAGT